MAKAIIKKTREKKEKNVRDPLPKDLFDILACPMCKADLVYNSDKTGLVCTKCHNNYPIKDGIPVLLPPELQES